MFNSVKILALVLTIVIQVASCAPVPRPEPTPQSKPGVAERPNGIEVNTREEGVSIVYLGSVRGGAYGSYRIESGPPNKRVVCILTVGEKNTTPPALACQ